MAERQPLAATGSHLPLGTGEIPDRQPLRPKGWDACGAQSGELPRFPRNYRLSRPKLILTGKLGLFLTALSQVLGVSLWNSIIRSEVI